MYIAPGFTLITCNPTDEDALRFWASSCGAIWHPAGEDGCLRTCARWNLGPPGYIMAWFETLSGKEAAEWIPLMHAPPQGAIDVILWHGSDLDADCQPFQDMLQSLFNRWDGYAFYIDTHEWVSEILWNILPPERIIRCELPAGPIPVLVWIDSVCWEWVDGIYQKRPADDNRDAD